jgi:hypothetical protein
MGRVHRWGPSPAADVVQTGLGGGRCEAPIGVLISQDLACRLPGSSSVVCSDAPGPFDASPSPPCEGLAQNLKAAVRVKELSRRVENSTGRLPKFVGVLLSRVRAIRFPITLAKQHLAGTNDERSDIP